MRRIQKLDLWEARFLKIVSREVNTLRYYQQLLKQHSHLIAGTKLQRILRRLVMDEINHVEIAKKLVEIVKAKQSISIKPDLNGTNSNRESLFPANAFDR